MNPYLTLGQEFYELEHAKPLFQKHNIMILRNLYTYHMYMEVFKILKFRLPMCLYENYSISSRKSMLLITPKPSNDFISRSATIWNAITPKIQVKDFAHNVSHAKSSLKKALLSLQHEQSSWSKQDHDIAFLKTKHSK